MNFNTIFRLNRQCSYIEKPADMFSESSHSVLVETQIPIAINVPHEAIMYYYRSSRMAFPTVK